MGPPAPQKTLIDGLTVATPGPNPNLPPRCGIDVMLVLDESGSIQSSGQTENVRNATRAFLNALSGTGAGVSIVDFSSTAARPVPYTTVTADTIANTFEPYLVNGYKPGGYTNWEAAFAKVREANTQGTLADLVVFITDGDPTALHQVRRVSARRALPRVTSRRCGSPPSRRTGSRSRARTSLPSASGRR